MLFNCHQLAFSFSSTRQDPPLHIHPFALHSFGSLHPTMIYSSISFIQQRHIYTPITLLPFLSHRELFLLPLPTLPTLPTLFLFFKISRKLFFLSFLFSLLHPTSFSHFTRFFFSSILSSFVIPSVLLIITLFPLSVVYSCILLLSTPTSLYLIPPTSSFYKTLPSHHLPFCIPALLFFSTLLEQSSLNHLVNTTVPSLFLHCSPPRRHSSPRNISCSQHISHILSFLAFFSSSLDFIVLSPNTPKTTTSYTTTITPLATFSIPVPTKPP